MALAPVIAERIDEIATSAASYQLATEHAANVLTLRVVEANTDRLVASVAVRLESQDAAWTAAARNIRVLQERLQDEFTAAMLEARSIGREFAMRQVALEAQGFLEPRHVLALTPSLPAVEVEAMWAHHAATGMARRFGSVAIAEASQWRAMQQTPAALPKRLRKVAGLVEGERKQHAVTQSVGVFNEAKRTKWAELKELQPKPLTPAPPKQGRGSSKGDPFDTGVREIWSAILDGKTCPVCWKLDGTMVKVGEPFPEGARTPVHGHCRCTVLTVFVPSELGKFLPGAELDYEALKDDIKDYMGKRNYDVGEGVRHAKRFVDEVLERRGHSPVVLTERITNRKKYFPNVTLQRAPALPYY